MGEKEIKKKNDVLKGQTYRLMKLGIISFLLLLFVAITIYFTFFSDTCLNIRETNNDRKKIEKYIKEINSFSKKIAETNQAISNYESLIENEKNYLNEFSLSREFINDVNAFVSYVDIVASECNIEIKEIKIDNDEEINKKLELENSLSGYKQVEIDFRGLSKDFEVFLDKLYTREIVYIDRFEITTDFDAININILFKFYKVGE